MKMKQIKEDWIEKDELEYKIKDGSDIRWKERKYKKEIASVCMLEER
jgi:hypothetical protein